jgi:DNA polymerase-3 subunit chi
MPVVEKPVPEIWFYQLQRRSLEQVLPNLIERTLQRGWRAVVQARTPERLAAIDDLLWTYAEDSFLPHGSSADGDAGLQAVWLTLGADNPNGAQIRFLVEGVEAEPFAEADYERLSSCSTGATMNFSARPARNGKNCASAMQISLIGRKRKRAVGASRLRAPVSRGGSLGKRLGANATPGSCEGFHNCDLSRLWRLIKRPAAVFRPKCEGHCAASLGLFGCALYGEPMEFTICLNPLVTSPAQGGAR